MTARVTSEPVNPNALVLGQLGAGKSHRRERTVVLDECAACAPLPALHSRLREDRSTHHAMSGESR
jgi:hypothetical protein